MYIKKYKKQGQTYYYLVEKRKGKIKTLESYGASPPVKYKPVIIKGFATSSLT